jgi:hypothetical protein
MLSGGLLREGSKCGIGQRYATTKMEEKFNWSGSRIY